MYHQQMYSCIALGRCIMRGARTSYSPLQPRENERGGVTEFSPRWQATGGFYTETATFGGSTRGNEKKRGIVAPERIFVSQTCEGIQKSNNTQSENEPKPMSQSQRGFIHLRNPSKLVMTLHFSEQVNHVCPRHARPKPMVKVYAN